MAANMVSNMVYDMASNMASNMAANMVSNMASNMAAQKSCLAQKAVFKLFDGKLKSETLELHEFLCQLFRKTLKTTSLFFLPLPTASWKKRNVGFFHFCSQRASF